MPIYRYLCTKCFTIHEVQRPVADYDKDYVCPKCNYIARRMPSTGVQGYVH